VDGDVREWTASEAAFRNADICQSLSLSCTTDEEPSGDSVGSALSDLCQLRVTWDARNLYIAAEATLGRQALLVFLDWQPGGLLRTSQLDGWRRGLEFGPDIRPDGFLAVRDAQTVPELWRATDEERAARVPRDEYSAAASFNAEASGRALEAAIPWTLLFPDAPRALDPEAGAPVESLFVLPLPSSQSGLRVAAAVVHAEDGFSSFDIAPDGSSPLPFDAQSVVAIERAVRVDWDAQRAAIPRFVDFGAALQTQSAARFVPDAPAPASTLQLTNLRTFAGGRSTRLVLADAGLDLGFAFDVELPGPSTLYLSAAVYTLRGERVRQLFRDTPRSPSAVPAPLGPYGDATLDRWDGRDDAGRPAPGAIYLLRVVAGPAPGVETSAVRRAVTVVR
jgi:hypothetical protein